MTAAGIAFEIETQPDIEDPGLRSLYDHWCELAKVAGGLPLLQSFDPLHLPTLLPNIWIVEVVPYTHRFRMRLTGEKINLIYGRNIAGQYFRDVFDATDCDRIVARYARALGEPAVFHASGSVYAAGNRKSVGERIGLPMVGRSSGTDTLLGATVYRAPLESAAPVLVTHDQPQFHRLRAGNHQRVEIAGG